MGEFEDANFALSKVIIGFCNAVVDVFKGFSALILMVVSTPTDAKSNVWNSKLRSLSARIEIWNSYEFQVAFYAFEESNL